MMKTSKNKGDDLLDHIQVKVITPNQIVLYILKFNALNESLEKTVTKTDCFITGLYQQDTSVTLSVFLFIDYCP